MYLFVMQEHTGRVFRLQFDEFQIVSSSHDDTILIWDFLNLNPSSGNVSCGPATVNASGASQSDTDLCLVSMRGLVYKYQGSKSFWKSYF